MKDYAAIATQYARDVVEGRIVACKWVMLACQRHLADLQRDAEGWRYTWNPELRSADETDAEGRVLRQGKPYRPGDRACFFIELLPHIKGEWAAKRELIKLEPSQVFVVASIFGWVDRATGKRRFRVADLFVPRKNAKSTLAAGIGLYGLTADFEFGAEIYSGATSEDQAGEVFKPAKLMARSSPDLLERFGVVVRESNISVPDTNSKFEPVIGKPGDGASPHIAIVDEYHEHPTEDLYDTMRTGMGARKQPLMLIITTAGVDVSGPCYAHQTNLQDILEGKIEDEQRFGIIYTIDEGDDWTTEAALIKANPNYGVSVDPEFLLMQQRDAIRDPRKQAIFQTKHLNMWVASANPWITLNLWKDCADPDLKIEHLAGENMHVSLDLANTTDIASRCDIFQRQIEGETHYFAFWKHYLPEETILGPENKHYQGWHRQGLLIATPGSMIDQKQIEDDIDADAEQYRISEIDLDAWGSPGISASLDNKGYTVVRIPQNVQHLSAPMKFIDGLVRSKRLHHNGDPIAAWAISNVEVKPDRNDNWFPRKGGSRARKIDPAVALIIGMSRAMVSQPEGSIDEWLKSVTPA